MNCSKNGIKKEGSSCSYNNKCIYPKCITDLKHCNMINKKVRIKTKTLETDVVILDKRMTNMAYFSNAAVMNNAPFEVYVGMLCNYLELKCPVIEFMPSDIIKIYE